MARQRKDHKFYWQRKFVCHQCLMGYADTRHKGGRRPKYCSDACKQKAYRENRKREGLS